MYADPQWHVLHLAVKVVCKPLQRRIVTLFTQTVPMEFLGSSTIGAAESKSQLFRQPDIPSPKNLPAAVAEVYSVLDCFATYRSMGEVAASDEMLERCIYGQLHPSCSACHCCLVHVCPCWLTIACQPSLILSAVQSALQYVDSSACFCWGVDTFVMPCTVPSPVYAEHAPQALLFC